jgi:hypothetical protein
MMGNEIVSQYARQRVGAGMTTGTSSFQLEGVFAGFFRDMLGKRRIVLRCEGEEVFLKVPKTLRRELEEKLTPGERVFVRGSEAEDEESGRDRRVVYQVSRVAEGSEVISCPIRVCAKKNCWRNGGKELWRELERRIDEAGLKDSVRLKAVDCLDRCKHGPNAEIGGCEFRRVSAADAGEILSRVTDRAT